MPSFGRCSRPSRFATWPRTWSSGWQPAVGGAIGRDQRVAVVPQRFIATPRCAARSACRSALGYALAHAGGAQAGGGRPSTSAGFHVLARARPTCSRSPAATASRSSTAARPPSRPALLQRVAALPGAGKIHTLFNTHWHPEQTGSNEALAQGRRDDRLAGEHASSGCRRTSLGRGTTRRSQPLPAGRAAEQDVLRPRGADDRRQARPVRTPARLPAHRRRHVRVLPRRQRARDRRRDRRGRGLARDRLVDRRLDRRHRRWDRHAAHGRELRTRGSCRRAARCSRTRISRPSTRCTARSGSGSRRRSTAAAARRRRSRRNPTKEFNDIMGPSDAFVRRAFESLWAYLSPDA